MLGAAQGLTKVKTAALKKALSGLHHGHLECPLTIEGLTRVGLQHCANDFLALLRDVPERGVRAVLVGVLAERIAAEKRRSSST